MPMIDVADNQLDTAAVLAEDDRLRDEAAYERWVQRSGDQRRATQGDNGLIFKRRENARPDIGGRTAPLPDLNGNDGMGGDACEVANLDDYLTPLAEAVGEFVGETCIELEAADAKSADRINGLQDQLKRATARHRHAKSRIADLEQQVATIARRIADLEKALPSARLAELEGKVKTLDIAIADEPSVRDLDSRVAYLEALLPMVVPMPSRLRA